MESDMQHDRAVNPHMSSNTSLDAGLSCWRKFFQEVINFSLEDVSANANAKKDFCYEMFAAQRSLQP